ncbi:hypothetical protein CF055_12095 [Clostridium botulinum]|uniref:hypothetical protein n=1 Tax=Clostridium botulinum TaxID=1491 RepID=UPI000467DA13|nr:hypothetical protein [Clostridium botulinum]APQ73679.1 hypothetical protein RSJ9_1085 [Clostridium botulinum]AUM86755.1 hypothetical protein RSJ15_03255 [Clostridium botulinum]NFO69627.1 hypothetical protein [Clostridium botulinum]
MNKIIIGFALIIIAALTLTSCSKKNKIKFDDEIVPYTKKETNEFSYKINNDTVRIKSNCGNLKIKKGNVDEVKVTIEKLVGGKSEDKLQEALDSISCTLEDGTINISLSSKDKSNVSSINIETTIVIPKKISSLNIENNIGNIELEGNYKDLKVQMENGNISYKGELEKSNISSKVGNINLNLQQLESNYQYEINGEVVNINIKVPNKSKINLIGSMANKVKVKDGGNISEAGAVFDINVKTGNAKIEN